ncbi:AraC-like DNA-binding protein [Tahibacter aquaticus]|uniref:AraC-like DNA-binding protein n=2 Tax=Tahibacter aquaticus TaxID=520092 RepID=A0A4R6Z4Y3_9GAMM|nr:AraC-like DNA-binding protein [Tahibacter aquaticus]
MPGIELTRHRLLQTSMVAVCDVCRRGIAANVGTTESADAMQLVFPYRGVSVWQFGAVETVAESNQVLLLNAAERFRVSHPAGGGDASLVLAIVPAQLQEMVPKALRRDGPEFAFRQRRLRIDPRAQALVAILRHSLRVGSAEPLEAESLALTLAQRALGTRTARAATASTGRQRLADRAKLVIASDLSRRWTLADIASKVGGSAVYLTQVFQQVEGLPLYRYQLRLRLARALDLMHQYDDLTALSLTLGFSSHSHFSAAFQQAYGRSPTQYRELARQR